MTHSIRRAAASLAGALFLLAAACDGPTAPRYGKLNLLLTDAPGDVLSAVVTIDQIYLQASEDGESGRIILRDEDVTVDLLTLADATTELIAGMDIQVGQYSQLRFVVSDAYIEVEGEDGGSTIYSSSTTYAGLPAGATVGGVLQMPSYAQTGIKVQLPGDAIVINEDQTLSLVVDFDVSQSFGKLAGGSGMWVMTPVIQATVPPTL